ncbi:hypothetical protein [Gilliamella sp. B3781]|uniref:hypothetical protein n=1 Tax=Gilliamella sp. B3781 TaxID=2818025 RepID=UPI00226A1FC0|nr:hypothetical protein [Gilliamella sp. B3781]MCX8714078.1 hypothetical protein [Gilliamella sp. B3781]
MAELRWDAVATGPVRVTRMLLALSGDGVTVAVIPPWLTVGHVNAEPLTPAMSKSKYRLLAPVVGKLRL